MPLDDTVENVPVITSELYTYLFVITFVCEEEMMQPVASLLPGPDK